MGEAREFIVADYAGGVMGDPPQYGFLRVLPPQILFFYKYDIQICGLWCILTASKSLVPADDWVLYIRGEYLIV